MDTLIALGVCSLLFSAPTLRRCLSALIVPILAGGAWLLFCFPFFYATGLKIGDEWKDQAAACGRPYVERKRALIDEFILPHSGAEVTALEIGPGHGRWTSCIVGAVKEIHLVELSPSCLEFCRKRFETERTSSIIRGTVWT